MIHQCEPAIQLLALFVGQDLRRLFRQAVPNLRDESEPVRGTEAVDTQRSEERRNV